MLDRLWHHPDRLARDKGVVAKLLQSALSTVVSTGVAMAVRQIFKSVVEPTPTEPPLPQPPNLTEERLA